MKSAEVFGAGLKGAQTAATTIKALLRSWDNLTVAQRDTIP